MKNDKKIMAVCGILCNECDIFKASSDPEKAQKIIDWFKKNNRDVKPEDIVCLTCRGDRTKHWSPDCPILKCCVDEKGLEYCYECDEFPCEVIEDWAKKDIGYTNALNRLKSIWREHNK